MALRLIRIYHEDDEGSMLKALEEQQPIDVRHVGRSEGGLITEVLVEAERSQAILDVVDAQCGPDRAHRVIVISVEATLPRPCEEEPEDTQAGREAEEEHEEDHKEEHKPTAAVEELRVDLIGASKPTVTFYVLVVLAAVVASVGILLENVAIIIGSMVIAPLLGPNMSLALATTLGDVPMARRSLIVIWTGCGLAIAVGTVLGLVYEVDPRSPEIVSRTDLSMVIVLVAFAAGVAGSISVVKGLPEALVGVMVAVALLPPLVSCGLLLGNGFWNEAGRSFVLFAVNLVCINLSAVTTFVFNGVRPSTWYERSIARRSVVRSVVLWGIILIILAAMIELYRRWSSIVG